MRRPGMPERSMSYGAVLAAFLSLTSTVSARGLARRQQGQPDIDKREPAIVTAVRLHQFVEYPNGGGYTTVITLLPGDPGYPTQDSGQQQQQPPAATTSSSVGGAGNLIQVIGGVSNGLASSSTAAPDVPPNLSANLAGIAGGVSSGLATSATPGSGSGDTFGKQDVGGGSSVSTSAKGAPPPIPSDVFGSSSSSSSAPLPSVTSVSGGGDGFSAAGVSGTENNLAGGSSLSSSVYGSSPTLGPEFTTPCQNSSDCARPPLVIAGNFTAAAGWSVHGGGSQFGALAAGASVAIAMLIFGL